MVLNYEVLQTLERKIKKGIGTVEKAKKKKI